jgi:hypothetical protein
MKKLKLKALELGAMELLTRAQLKNVLGGDDYGGAGTCCAHSADWISYVSCGLDKATAIAYADQYASGSGQHGYWCCSCH